MARMILPLLREDYEKVGLDHRKGHDRLSAFARKVNAEERRVLIAVTHRLANADWMSALLEEQYREGEPPLGTESLLAMHIHLLLTCADAIGTFYVPQGSIVERFRACFDNLPSAAKGRLVQAFLVWKAEADEVTRFSTMASEQRGARYPSRHHVQQFLWSFSNEERFNMVVDFLAVWRNWFTYEIENPQLGYHLILSTMQKRRLKIPHPNTLGDYEGLQVLPFTGGVYFAYFETQDTAAELRGAILHALFHYIQAHLPGPKPSTSL